MKTSSTIYRLHWRITDAATGEYLAGKDTFSQELDKLPTEIPENLEFRVGKNKMCRLKNPRTKLPIKGRFDAVVREYLPQREKATRQSFDDDLLALLDKYNARLDISGEYRGDNRTVGNRLKFNSQKEFFDYNDITVKVEFNITQLKLMK